MQPDTRDKVLQAIRKAASVVSREKDRGELKKGKSKSNTGVSSSNVVLGKRKHNPIQPSGGNGSAKKVK